MKKNMIMTMCIAVGVVGIGVAGLIVAMNLDKTNQTKGIEQVPINSVTTEADAKNQTEENDKLTTTEVKNGNQDSTQATTASADNLIQFEGISIPIVSDSDVDTSKLEISMKEAARIGLSYIKSAYTEEFNTGSVSMEAVSMSGIKSGSVAWNEVIEVDGICRYELSVDAQTGEVLDSSSYYRANEDTQEWIKADEDSTGRTIKIEKLDLEAFEKINVEISYCADVEIVQGDSYGVVMNYRADNYKLVYENKAGTLQIKDSTLGEESDGINSNSSNYVTIIVPKEAKFSSITINSTSGDITIKDIVTDSLATLTLSGESTLGRLTASKINCESYSGDINMKNVDCNNQNLKALSGDITVEGRMYGKTVCDAVSGDINVVCSENVDQYSYDTSAVTGTIKVGDETNDDEIIPAIKSYEIRKNHIKATTTSGDITIGFGVQ